MAVEKAVALHVGERIKAAREGKLTQRALGERIRVDPNVISRWERGINKPDLDMLDLLGRELGVPAAFFIEGLGAKPASADAEAPERDHPAELADLDRALEILQTTVDLQFELLIQMARRAKVSGVEELARKMREQR